MKITSAIGSNLDVNLMKSISKMGKGYLMAKSLRSEPKRGTGVLGTQSPASAAGAVLVQRVFSPGDQSG